MNNSRVRAKEQNWNLKMINLPYQTEQLKKLHAGEDGFSVIDRLLTFFEELHFLIVSN
jgi:hypothetical protein